MICAQSLIAIGHELDRRAGKAPPAVYDIRTDGGSLIAGAEPDRLRFVRHQTLFRSYQGRYVLLPSAAPDGSILDRLRAHYDPRAMLRLDALRADLEDELIAPLVGNARCVSAGRSATDYIADLAPGLARAAPNGFIAHLEKCISREHHYRNFLIQSSVDLLAEASASALGVIGEYGEPQSALFRILIDEFGYGAHNRKHSVLYRSTLRGFGLDPEYNAFWPLFDTPTLELHNVIHFMFQSPRNLFLQIGFLLYAEASYQRSTGEHFLYLKRFHPGVDGRYFGEHAHIDVHHAAIVAGEVVGPLVSKFGPEVGAEIVAGAELTRLAFERAGEHMLAVAQAFDAAAEAGAAGYGMAAMGGPPGRCVIPAEAEATSDSIQVGGIGTVEPAAFTAFPEAAVGRAP